MQTAPSLKASHLHRGTVLSGFESFEPQFLTPQGDLLGWLAEAHARAAGVEPGSIRKLLDRYSASMDHIATRGHELADFSHRHWESMRLFGPRGTNLKQKTEFFAERVNALFKRVYPTGSPAPQGLVHVTCTGYVSPSGAQNLVSARNWGQKTEVLHAYHMGCYAAHPAIRMACGLQQGASTVDVVHSELCSLHLDLSRQDPAQFVIQSVFADGFIKYRVGALTNSHSTGLKILAARDEILPDSTEAMAWSTGPFQFLMELSKSVPVLLASALPRFVERLLEEAGLDPNTKRNAYFAVHPGGPRIIELAQKVLQLEDRQVQHSRDILRQRGNMSSATLPHIWQRLVEDPAIKVGTVIVSLGAGPGLTLSGMVFVKASP